jgi:hypothetical protein
MSIRNVRWPRRRRSAGWRIASTGRLASRSTSCWSSCSSSHTRHLRASLLTCGRSLLTCGRSLHACGRSLLAAQRSGPGL